MKLKVINDHQIVVDKYEYAKLVRLENRLQNAEKSIGCGINPEFYLTIDQGTINTFVVMSIDGFLLRIKCFDSDDWEYNILCANELVELLNAEQ